MWKFIKKLQKKSAHPILYFLFMVILCVYVSWQMVLFFVLPRTIALCVIVPR